MSLQFVHLAWKRQLKIQSYEIGVLFTSKDEVRSFTVCIVSHTVKQHSEYCGSTMMFTNIFSEYYCAATIFTTLLVFTVDRYSESSTCRAQVTRCQYLVHALDGQIRMPFDLPLTPYTASGQLCIANQYKSSCVSDDLAIYRSALGVE